MDVILKFIQDNKDTLGFLFGSGVLLALLGLLARGIVWFVRGQRARHVRADTFPFDIIPPNSDVPRALLGGEDKDPLADRNIPYQSRLSRRNIRRELEDALEEHRWALILSRSGLGKTREAVHVLQSLNNEGWTILYFNKERAYWLDAPAHLPPQIARLRKVLFFFDDLNRLTYAGRLEQSPRAGDPLQSLTVPFQERLRRAMETYETLCGGKGYVRLLATARDEKTPDAPAEPSPWEKLAWEKYPSLWKNFTVYHLPEPEDDALQRTLAENAEKAGISVNPDDLPRLVRRSECTFVNIIENLRTARRENRALNVETFKDTMKGNWESRYRRAVERHPAAAPLIYDAVNLLRSANIALTPLTVWLTVWILAKGNWLNKTWRWARSRAALDDLIRSEDHLLHPRDGQIEAKGTSLDWPPYAASLTRLILLLTRVRRGAMLGSLYTFGATLYDAREYKLLAVLMKRGTEIALAEAGLWNNLGVVYSALGRSDEAIAEFQKAIQLDPKLAHPHNGLGNVYPDLGRSDDAIAEFQKAIQLDPQDAAPYYGLGNVYYDLKRYDDALAANQRAIQLDPNNPYAHNNLAGEYVKQRRFDDARHELNERIRLKPDNALAPLVTLGILARHQGLAESDDHFRRALAQWDAAWREKLQTPAGLLENKAEALLCLGRKEEALQTLQEAIAQMLPGDTIEFDEYELLRTAPDPPEGIDEIIALLKSAT
ncbi:MAG: tetratricopeptide repeat protein [Anaerolineales bacterium]|nr:tetratricopeptide repeat protein [Anaerolineales bacterium]